ncbi:MAG TPA: hypothetical protein VF771_06945 [Longimicrobiaceae bacterium]
MEMKMRRMIAVAATCVLAPAACTGKKSGPSAISRERFVQANVDMRAVPDTAANASALRAAALKKYRVTEPDLRRFVAVHGRNAEYMSTVWREISDSLQKRYDRSFPTTRPGTVSTAVPVSATNERPVVPQTTVGADQPPVPAQQPPPAGVQPRSPQRPHPPKIPVNGPRMVAPPAAHPPRAPLDSLRRER